MIELTVWVVYCHPSDYPNSYVVRGQDVIAGRDEPVAHAEPLIVSSDLPSIREELERRGLICLARRPDDDPVIVETWL